MNKKLQITRRHLPHWQLAGSYYFITFRVKNGILSNHEKELILRQIIKGNDKYYQLIAAVVLNDHAHTILKPSDDVPLSRIMKGIKGASARKINEQRNCSGALWQAESFDRIIRDDKELLEKANYILFNPVKLGIIENPWEYRFLYVTDIKF